MFDVLKQMDRNQEGFRAVSNQFDGTMELVAEFHEGYPGLVFEPALVRRLADYALLVDFDFYWFSDGSEEDTPLP